MQVTVNGVATTFATVAANAVVNLEVTGTDGEFEWRLMGNHDGSYDVSPASTGKRTATLTTSLGLGQAHLLEYTKSGDTSVRGTVLIGVAKANGIVPFAAGEFLERGVAGWAYALNAIGVATEKSKLAPTAVSKSLGLSDWGGTDPATTPLIVTVSAGASIYFPTDSARQIGTRIVVVRTFSGNVICDGNGVNVQGRSHSYGSQNWFLGTMHGVIRYIWTGSVWAYDGLPASVDGQIQAQALYNPNEIVFVDNSVSRTGVVPIQRASASIASGSAINADHPMTDGKREKVKFRFSMGTDYVLEYEATAKRSGATVTMLTPLKTLYGPSEYTSVPSVTPTLSAPGSGILRCSLLQSSGSAQAMTASTLSEAQ